MPIVPVPMMLEHASRRGYALGAFVCMSLEMVGAVVKAAEAEDAPVVIRLHPSVRVKTPFAVLAEIVRAYALRARVPVGLSLDHGRSVGDVADAIRAGCTEVMRDAGEEELEGNVAAMKEAALVAHPLGVATEAAIGRMPHGIVQTRRDLASVRDAIELVERADVDVLAPAVGNVHGTAHGEVKAAPALELDLISALSEGTGVPLCLHGGSSISDVLMREAVDRGIRMVIIYTDVVTAFNREMRRVLEVSPDGADVLAVLEPAQRAAGEVVRHKLEILGGKHEASHLLFGEGVVHQGA